MTTDTPTRMPETEKRAGGFRWLWMLVLIAVVAIGGAVLWLLLSGGEGEPTVTFDGQTATYDGPTTFTPGEVTFTFDATAYEPGVAFVLGQITDDNVTFEDMETWGAEQPATSQPPWLIVYDVTFAVDEDRVVEKSLDLREGVRYGLFANTAPTDTNRAHPAAILNVENQ